MVEKQRMEITFVYTGERRFENIGKKNNHLHLYQALSEFTSFKIIDKCKENRNNDEFTLSAQNQIWDFYKGIDDIDTDIIIRMRTDVWFAKSCIPHIVNEILKFKNGNGKFCLLGSELFRHFDKEWEEYQLPDVRTPAKSHVKTGDFMLIARKDELRSKEEVYKWLSIERSKSGNRTWQRIRKTTGHFSFGQIYLLRAEYKNVTDEYIALEFAKHYGPKTKIAQKYYYERLSSNN
jgi:hypothetical protein